MSDWSKELVGFLESNKDKKIVFTNGCFDILHSGHVEYLNEAKAQGDLLVLGLNSDKSVSSLKGPSRPVNKEQDRKYLLENLRAIDFVEIFNDSTPLDLVKFIKPDIYVKGGDWDINDVPEAQYCLSIGKEAKMLSFKKGYSTTNIIEKIKD